MKLSIYKQLRNQSKIYQNYSPYVVTPYRLSELRDSSQLSSRNILSVTKRNWIGPIVDIGNDFDICTEKCMNREKFNLVS
ncbi:hypothetical protein EWB00_001886 [Schistosoma japonicum]|uniref:Uncharacterized protein n=1 Tax=Schistosoma japonicum TaxID=6182 RepID=A0A4Z2DE23_SCHJA|nr:hypothetical protein KSF78_0008073 [Schistosoma japonicum]TNN14704.1 hypothetical protein EWB00_001886 [Schistosoma japonicum]